MSVQIIQGNALAIPLADQSVHCVVTSPPYWGLRDYGVEGQLGLEPTFDEYLANMLKVFAEVHRVLRDDGTLWLNMGDGYASFRDSKCVEQTIAGHSRGEPAAGASNRNPESLRAGGFKHKDMIGQPWALAFALRAAGWYLRSDIIWAKPAPMPESVTDRPTKAHEYLFLLTKREQYFFDQAAWLEPCAPESDARLLRAHSGYFPPGQQPQGGMCGVRPNRSGNKARKIGAERGAPAGSHVGGSVPLEGSKRNRRTVWTVGSQPTPEAHFATFPEALVEPCLLAGCPSKCCPVCGQGWEPIEEKSGGSTGKGDWTDKSVADERGMVGQKSASKSATTDGTYRRELKGYAPGCACATQDAPVHGIAFDPFGGSGTVCAVANRMGRRGIMLELNPAYIEIAMRRIFADVVPTPEERAKGQRLAFA